ncbi:MAG TPA: hypothetical protein VFF13_04125 [archaeon]|nr:hypothetical protein [archaeon]
MAKRTPANTWHPILGKRKPIKTTGFDRRQRKNPSGPIDIFTGSSYSNRDGVPVNRFPVNSVDIGLRRLANVIDKNPGRRKNQNSLMLTKGLGSEQLIGDTRRKQTYGHENHDSENNRDVERREDTETRAHFNARPDAKKSKFGPNGKNTK